MGQKHWNMTFRTNIHTSIIAKMVLVLIKMLFMPDMNSLITAFNFDSNYLDTHIFKERTNWASIDSNLAGS